MNEINKRPYKKLSNSELYLTKNDIDIRSEHRSLAEAEIAYRQERRKQYTVVIAAIGLAVAVIYNFGPWVLNAL